MFTKEYAICVIDDDPNEIKRIRDNLNQEKLDNGFIIGAGKTIIEAIDELQKQGRKKPDIFILDLYRTKGELPTKEQLTKLQNKRESFLKTQRIFETELARLGWSAVGGFEMAKDISLNYGSIPYLFFTRKGTLEDVINIMKTDAIKVMKKPEFIEADENISINRALNKAFKKNAKHIANEIRDAITVSSWWYKNKQSVMGFLLGILASIAANIIWIF